MSFLADNAKFIAPAVTLLMGGAGTGYIGYDTNTDLREANAAALAAKQQTIELKQKEIENIWARYSAADESWADEEVQLDAHIRELQEGMRDTIKLCEVWR